MSDRRGTRLVIALGGSALPRRGERPDIEAQRSNVRTATQAIAQVARGTQIVVTHGDGPQVGLLALQAEAYRGARPYPLDVLGAQSEGMICYLVEEELRNELPGRDIATLLTQVIIDPADPAFARPSKPIGSAYLKAIARRLAASRRWTVGADGEAWRRMVPSPEPRRIVEISAIRLLVEAGVVVICAGGGGRLKDRGGMSPVLRGNRPSRARHRPPYAGLRRRNRVESASRRAPREKGLPAWDDRCDVSPY